MPTAAVKLIPGVNVEFTPSLNQAGVSDTNLVRCRNGLWEKLGGWVAYYPIPAGSRVWDLHAWQDLNSTSHLAVAAETILEVITNDVSQDITPRTDLANFARNFSTTSGSSIVTVVDSGSNVSIYDTVYFNTPIAVGGIVLEGAYAINTVLSANSYRIDAGVNATSTVSSGGSVPAFTTLLNDSFVTVTFTNHGKSVGDTVVFIASTTVGGVTIQGAYEVTQVITANSYLINAAQIATSTATASMNGGLAQVVYYRSFGPRIVGSGYGQGGYGLGGYGLGEGSSTAPSGTPITATDWFTDNWGEIVLANAAGGPIYYWSPVSGFVTASVITDGPFVCNGIFVAMPQQILVGWGCESGGAYDPLLLRWSDAGNFLSFTPSSSNQAGSFRIPTGSKIVRGLQAPGRALIWTDVDLYAMQYVGAELAFGFNKLASGCGMVAPHAVGVLGTAVYWMASGQFFVSDGGGAAEVPCPVWDAIFQDLDTANLDKITAMPNSQFDEIAWCYPTNSEGSGENSRYVKYNTRENTWDIGALVRTAWLDQSLLGSAMGTDASGMVFQHERGYSADGASMNSYIQTGYFMISDGDAMGHIDWIWPDFKWRTYNGTPTSVRMQVTIQTVDYPNAPVKTHGPFTFTDAVQWASCRARGRQQAWLIQSSDASNFWRMGNLRYRVQPDGRR